MSVCFWLHHAPVGAYLSISFSLSELEVYSFTYLTLIVIPSLQYWRSDILEPQSYKTRRLANFAHPVSNAEPYVCLYPVVGVSASSAALVFYHSSLTQISKLERSKITSYGLHDVFISDDCNKNESNQNVLPMNPNISSSLVLIPEI